MCDRTQNDAIWGLIAPFLTNQIAGNTIDFKMNVIKLLQSISFNFSLQYSELRCEVRKFVAKFKSSFQNSQASL